MTASSLLEQYQLTLTGKAGGTVDAYMRALRKLTDWIAERPGSEGQFRPDQFTQTALQSYLDWMEREGYSASYRILVKSAASGFARWLIEERQLLQRDPTRRVQIAAQPLLAPRLLTDDQRYVLKSLVERHSDRRGAAAFALGYWAGCRVSDVSWLKVADVDLRPRTGSATVGYKGGKRRLIDLALPARQPLTEYLQNTARNGSPFVFTSQRSERWSEAGIHHWFRELKAKATKGEWELVHDISFHDLRHDFAHRARESGWSLEEVAYYLGHITKKGTPALQTTVRYTQASREQVKVKLSQLVG